MIYLAGIDGGGTKTCCVIGDSGGNVLARGVSAASNHQVVGPAAAKAEIRNSITRAAETLGISIGDISYTVLGLAGADLEKDFAILDEVCGDIIPNGRFKVMNDSWIGLRAGIPENWGIVTICGTGAGCSGRNRSGEEATLRNLTYEAGNCKGGFGIICDAFHHAFRSEEGTGPKTKLEAEIPAIFGKKRLSELLEPVLQMKLDAAKAYQIPVAVGRFAAEGDTACQEILLSAGRLLGEIAAGIILKLGMAREKFKVTLVGSVFKADSPLLIDEYTTTVHKTAPFAQIGVSAAEPAIGAYELARELYIEKIKA